MSRRWVIVGVVVLAFVITAYMLLRSRASLPASTQKTVVFASIVPQEYFVQRIGGERVEVQALVEWGQILTFDNRGWVGSFGCGM